MAAGARLVMIDRDGVINEDSGEFIKSVAEWRPIAGSLEAIASLHRAGWMVTVVTNQSGVGRGLYDEATLAKIHEHMRERVRSAGGSLAGVYYCPHLPDAGCECRKPKPGMFRALERELACPSWARRTPAPERTSKPRTRSVRGRCSCTGTGAATVALLGARRYFDDLAGAARLLARRGVTRACGSGSDDPVHFFCSPPFRSTARSRC
jgi:D-glycero-D-manno-heptose 1,7-bisphosphate phosphatase